MLEECFPWAGKHQKYQLNWNCSLIGSWKGGDVGTCRFLGKKKKVLEIFGVFNYVQIKL